MSDPATTLPPIITSTVRHALTALAGVLVAQGLLSSDQSAGTIQTVIGVVLGGIGFGWSMARAGKLGSQAQTISALMDQLLDCTPATDAPPPATASAGLASSLDYAPVKAFTTMPPPPQFTNNDQGNS